MSGTKTPLHVSIDTLFGAAYSGTVSVPSVDTVELVRIFRRMTQKAKNALKLSDGFSPLTSHIGDRARIQQLILGPGLSEKTHMCSAVKYGDRLGYGRDGDVFYTANVYLSRNGEVILVVFAQKGFFYEVKCSIVSDHLLVLMINSCHGRLEDLMETLYSLVSNSIKRRQEQLEDLQEEIQGISLMWKIFDFPSGHMSVQCISCGTEKKRMSTCEACGDPE